MKNGIQGKATKRKENQSIAKNKPMYLSSKFWISFKSDSVLAPRKCVESTNRIKSNTQSFGESVDQKFQHKISINRRLRRRRPRHHHRRRLLVLERRNFRLSADTYTTHLPKKSLQNAMFNPYWKWLYWHESNIENNHKKDLKICNTFYDSNLVMISLGLFGSVCYVCVCVCVCLLSLLLPSQCLIFLWYMWLLFVSFTVFHVSSARVPAIHHQFAWMLLGFLFYFRLFANFVCVFFFFAFYFGCRSFSMSEWWCFGAGGWRSYRCHSERKRVYDKRYIDTYRIRF